ncbi:MAG: NAD(P)H-hydrate dehydratase [Candidatus Kuenenia stuttgartiensis]|nr:NAD(P)H-hydrate dehydratase [Candidatus Kuenenia stuttgartiensis]
MKIFSASQIRACDTYTIHASKISSYELMEKAASQCFAWINNNLPADTVFIILCGSGNNGGDGLAITRMLHRQGYSAKAFLLRLSDELTEDCRKNFERLNSIEKGLAEILPQDSLIADVPEHVVIIDALLGTGLNRPAEGWVADFISHINELPNSVISVDIPSGMPADNIPGNGAQVIHATHTLSFQFYKRSFLHPETGLYTGKVHILDIGLSSTFITSTHTSYYITDEQIAKAIYVPANAFAHKGDHGQVLIVAGSKSMMGAAVLASKAALRAGAGKVKALVPECGYDIMQISVPEAMCYVSGETCVSRIKDWQGSVVGIGPGLGTNEATIRAFADFISACKEPMVVDADGLNILAQQPELLHKLPVNSVLTPHPREFERLFGTTKDSMQMVEIARTQSMKYNMYFVLKGHYTVVVTPEGECWYNMTGNAGMATGGRGDVLTGIIAGLMARGYASFDAARLGVYLHGLAGDYAAAVWTENAMVAGDIVEQLGNAFRPILV